MTSAPRSSRPWSKTLAAVMLCVCCSAAYAGASPRVVASIKPVHALVAGVMAGVGEPVLLVEGGASPHTYTLRPSQARALESADVVFWVGSGLETFLAKSLLALARQAHIVALHEADGITLLEAREGGRFTPAGHGAGAPESNGDAHHAHGSENMHIWLDPMNASAMVTWIVTTLTEVDADNADLYRQNGTVVQQRLAALHAMLMRLLTPLKGRPYIVLHDAYPYLERRYKLTPAGAITVSPDRRPSARRVAEIRELISDSGAECVFAEPQFPPAVVTTVVEGTGARTGVLDPLGAELDPGPDAYFVLMRNLADALAECLATSQ